MQNSPQEIKTRLDRAVDPDGNVLDMAAVLDVVTVLERIPLTREALEKTRIGKTINQLRKKTENVDLARRAKKLVKRWQKSVQNHIDAIRNADSPLNGSRVASPLLNGTIRDSDSLPGTPTCTEGLKKLKSTEGKKRGLKRKRGGSSSSESSPVVFGKLSDRESSSRTDTPTTEGANSSLPSPSCIIGSAITLSQSQTDICTPKALAASSCGNDSDQLTSSASTLNSRNEKLASRTGLHELEGNISETGNGEVTVLVPRFDVCENQSAVSSKVATAEDHSENCNENSEKPQPDQVSDTINNSNVVVETAGVISECDKKLVGLDEDSPETELPPLRPPKSPSEMELEINAEARGINGQFGEDGSWYNWTEIMPCNEGSLNILPYVLLE